MLQQFQKPQQHLEKFYHKITNKNETLDFNSRRRRGRLRLQQLQQQQPLQTNVNRQTQQMPSQQSLNEKYKAFYNVPAAKYLNNVANVITTLLLTQVLSFIKQINSFVNKPQQQKPQQTNNLVLSLINKIHKEIIYNKNISTGKRKISPKIYNPNATPTPTLTTTTTTATPSPSTTFLLYALLIITTLLILPCHHPNALAEAAKPKSATQQQQHHNTNNNNNHLQHQHQQDKPLIAYAAGADNVHIDKEGSVLTPPSYQIVSSQTSNEEETEYILDSDERNFDLENESINEVNEEERDSYEKFDNVAAASVAAALASSSGAPSETQSEISSVESDWSDIRAIALKLGVSNPDDLHTERFKVDRQKLEQMIKAESVIEGVNGAEYFFESIMKTTETYISWPCRLKIGAKSKKDPHVRIVGKIDEVTKAKERILANLDSRGTRVIMKMDVSYTDHSYIIGRGGNNIKSIMEDTSTHIHFPDSNRSNPTEKSNQVSLCGSLEGVEKARALVRLSTPLLISFELPVMAPGRPQPDKETPYVTFVEQKYNVQVIFSSRPKLHSSLILVKGSEKEAGKVKEATQILINFSCDNIANQIMVNMQLEISPQHHEIVKGKNNTNLLSIMERTNTKIIFPDLSDMNVKPLKKSQVTISGTIECVYKARQQLLGNLPIALIFDFPDNQNDASEIMSLSTKYGVYITLRQKQRQSTLAIVIKGVEKFIDKIYEARHEILRLTTPIIKAEIPETYLMPKDKDFNLVYRATVTALLAGYTESSKTPNTMPAEHLQISAYGNNNNLSVNRSSNNNNNNSSNNNCNQNLNQINRQQYGPAYPGTPTGVCSPTQKYMQIHNSTIARQQQQPQLNQNNNFMQVLQQQHQQQLPSLHAQKQMQPSLHLSRQQPPSASQSHNVSPRNSYSNNTSGYQSFSSSTTSLEQAYPPYGHALSAGNSICANGPSMLPNNRPSPYSPDSNYSSEAGSGRYGRRCSDGVLLGLNTSGTTGALLPGSAESYRNLHYSLKNRTFDFDIKRAMGFKAMERPPIAGELRTPTTNWMGMGLSNTSPAPIETVDDLTPWQRSLGGVGFIASPYALGATTGIIDSTPSNRRLQLTQCKDLHTLMTSIGLEHYIKMFVLNEIDLEMFTTLTEENLVELGVTAFGARKKMLTAIHTLQAKDAAASSIPTASSTASSPRFSGSAAPGAERRPSNQW